MTKIAIVVLDHANMLSLAAAVDPLRATNRHAQTERFKWVFATPTAAPVTLTSGLPVTGTAAARVPACDIVIVVAGFEAARQTTPSLAASLQRLAGTAQAVLAIDGGAWVLAKAGLLTGHQATTHWEDLDSFARAFPETTVDNARYVLSGPRWTSGGAAPALDMMLHLIEHTQGPQLAAKVAAGFIHTSRPAASDPQIRHPTGLRHSALTARAHRLMEAHMEPPLPIPDLAARLGQNPRTLLHHFQKHLGRSPKAYYLTLRLAEAHRCITQTDAALLDVALATGFGAQSSLTRAYTAQYGQSPRAARRQHAAPSPP